MSRLILSLDIGSSSCKATLFNEVGQEISAGKGCYSLQHTHIGVEQRPEDLWSGVCEAIRLTSQHADANNIAAIALSAQISSHFFVDDNNVPLTNIISWLDSRALTEANEMKEAFSSVQLFELMGAEIPVGPSWHIPKLRWFMKHQPGVIKQARYMIQPKEWILWKLTSVWRTDLSSLRGVANQLTGSLCTELLHWAGLQHVHIFPPIGKPYEISGLLGRNVAEMLGLPSDIPVVLGWNDLNTSVLGTVGIDHGIRGFDITGTSEHIGIIGPYSTTPNQPVDTGINRIPFVNEHGLIYGVTSSGGEALKWYVENIDQHSHVSHDYHAVVQQAQTVAAGSEGLLFLPYLNGERSPWWNPVARGVFFGLSRPHDRRHMARAVLEGVGFALQSIVSRLEIKPESLVVAGGLSKIQAWNQIKADILGIPLIPIKTTDAGCLGAAILAAYGLKWYDSLKEACSAMIRNGDLIEPNGANHTAYSQQYDIFLQVYKSLLPVYDAAFKINTDRERGAHST